MFALYDQSDKRSYGMHLTVLRDKNVLLLFKYRIFNIQRKNPIDMQSIKPRTAHSPTYIVCTLSILHISQTAPKCLFQWRIYTQLQQKRIIYISLSRKYDRK